MCFGRGDIETYDYQLHAGGAGQANTKISSNSDCAVWIMQVGYRLQHWWEFPLDFPRGSRLACWMVSVSRRGRSYASRVIKRVRSIPSSDWASPPWSLPHHHHRLTTVTLIFMEHARPPSKCKPKLISTYIKLPTTLESRYSEGRLRNVREGFTRNSGSGFSEGGKRQQSL